MKGISNTYTYLRRLSAVCCALLSFLVATSQNAIETENNLNGNPKSEWDLPGGGAGDLNIQGFATDISVNRGQRIRFKIKADGAPGMTIEIYRMGWYGGDGARKWGNGVVTTTFPYTQPNPIEDPVTGLTDCGNWTETGYWDVPANAVSGVYIAKITRTDYGGASHIIFIVRQDGNTSDIFYQTADATWQAYNPYGGNSFYVAAGSLPNGHASKISYNRPFVTRSGGGGGTVGEDWFFNSEYPMIRFLERFGYNVTYTTNVDAVRSPGEFLLHKTVLSVGHDEYWSAEQRNTFVAARAAGVHLGFFSGNEVYWKTRWENSTDGSNTPLRTLVCYKEGDMGEKQCGNKCDPNPTVWTGLWRNPMGSSYDAGIPENTLSGQISWEGGQGAMVVPAAFKNLRIWRNTNIPSLGAEGQATFPMGTLGYEWNYEQYPEYNPPGRITMSSTTINGKNHRLSLYRHSSGSLVFGAGTIQWAWGLDATHDGLTPAADQRMQQATINILADMQALASNTVSNQLRLLLAGLTRSTTTTDNTPPTTTITSHANGALIPIGVPVTISGTSTDGGGGVVGGIEISVDNGVTWKVASGTSSWSYTFTTFVEGPITVKVRGTDDSGRMEVVGSSGTNVRNLTVGFPPPPPCPCSIFTPGEIPTGPTLQDNPSGIEVGVKFKSNIAGYITGLRFYKTAGNTGTHTGSLWSADGTLLSRAVFINETASGWQEVNLNTPVTITAGTTYVASYHSSNGYYTETVPYFGNPKFNNPLIAQANLPGNANGVYLYTSSPAFPTSQPNGSNYYMDVVLNTTPLPDVVPPVVLSTVPVNGASSVSLATSISARFNEPLDPVTVNATNVELRDAANALIPTTRSYNNGLYTISITPTVPLSNATTYSIILKGGASGIKDVSGNSLASNSTTTFTTAGAPAVEGPGGPILIVSSGANPFSRYPVEIMRAEGLNHFKAEDLTLVTPSELANYDVVILGDVFLNSGHVTMFQNWLNTTGGTLIAFKPHPLLAPLMGLTPTGSTLSNKYIQISPTGPGFGIVNQTMQYHGTADLYTLNGATSLAMLYSDAVTATTNPAVTTINVGSNGGKAIAFTYDLARSIVYTRQGNPAWVGQKRDGQAGPIRSDDMFFGGTDPDWIDFNKVAIPQADEQQRLLVNIIMQNNLARRPLPRFWFLPSGHKAAFVMTGDDHANNGTQGRYNMYKAMAPNTAQDILDWKAIRASSYLFNGTPLNADTALKFNAEGFEVALHVNTGCFNQDEAGFENTLVTQLASLASQFPGLPAPVTNRTHCIAWNDWATVAKVEARHGIRLDVNYYYWPGSWIQNRPGMFTGSGMPMRFADLDGTVIDCYQVATQLTDESDISYTPFVTAMLDKALGAEGYYGVFATNMHTDVADHPGSNAVTTAALARNVPVVSAKQMLTWLDGRNNSSFGSITWAGNQLSFSISAAPGSNNLRAMVPYTTADGAHLVSITRGGTTAVPFTREVIKGIEYAFFDGSVSGNYVAVYAVAGNLIGNITLVGRGAIGTPRWQVDLVVQLFQGTSTTPVATYNVTTNQNGIFTIPNVPEGDYRIGVKKANSLRNLRTTTIISGDNTVNFGTLREGDVNNNNSVSAVDFSLLLNSFNKTVGNPGYDSRCDFNGDNFVTAADYSLMLNNFNKAGDNP